MTSRPDFVWMPTPGPVAYHVHPSFLTCGVISTGLAQVAPSSVLFVTQAVRDPLLLPVAIFSSVSSPRLCVINSQIVPVARSTTGQGLPQVFLPSSQTTWVGCQVLPPSELRRSNRSMSPASPRPVLRPSQKASRVPLPETIRDGMR